MAGTDLALDALDNIYVSGYTAIFDAPGVSFGGYYYLGAGKDAFVASFTAGGHYRWVRHFGGAGQDRANGVAVDQAGNVFATGYFEHDATFSGVTKTAAGKFDIYLLRLTP